MRKHQGRLRKQQVNQQLQIAQQEPDCHESTESVEIIYMDKAMDSFVWWGYGVGPQEPLSFARLLGMQDTNTAGYQLSLTDDQYMAIDAVVAKLSREMRQLIDLEYREGGSAEQKAERFGATTRGYRLKLNEMLSCVYQRLMPAVEDWEEQTRWRLYVAAK